MKIDLESTRGEIAWIFHPNILTGNILRLMADFEADWNDIF